MTGTVRRAAPAVIGDLDDQLVIGVLDAHLTACGSRVRHHVGDRLLDDPVRGQLDVGRQRPAGTPPRHRYADPGIAGQGRQLADVGQAGRRGRRQRAAVGLPEPGQHPPQAGQGVPAGALDHAQRGAGHGRLVIDDQRAGTGLDGDDPDAVRHHVVQVAGDPQPLGRHRAGCRLSGQRFVVLAALPDRVAGHPGDDQGHGQDQRLIARAEAAPGQLLQRRVAGQRGRQDPGRSQAGPPRPPRRQEADQGVGRQEDHPRPGPQRGQRERLGQQQPECWPRPPAGQQGGPGQQRGQPGRGRGCQVQVHG